MTVVTRNTADFAALGVALINPWQAFSVHEPQAVYPVRKARLRRNKKQ